MSVYNGERWLNESIASVLNQTHQEFNFIIVNDGSEDSSLEIITKFASKDQRIKVINKPNTGLTSSLNFGISHTNSEWIARMDSDDLCEKNRLAEQYDLTKKNKSVVLIGSSAIEINSQSILVKNHVYPQKHQELVRHLHLISKSFFPHSSAFMRTKTVRDLGGYRERLKRAQDYDLWLRMSSEGEIRCIKSPLVKIRKHAGQVSNENRALRQLVDSRVALVSHLLCRLGFPDPVAPTSTDHQFDEFRKFIQNGVERNRLVLFRHFISKVKKLWIKPQIKRKYFSLKVASSYPSFVLRYCKEKVFGEDLGTILCKEWIARTKK